MTSIHIFIPFKLLAAGLLPTPHIIIAIVSCLYEKDKRKGAVQNMDLWYTISETESVLLFEGDMHEYRKKMGRIDCPLSRSSN